MVIATIVGLIGLTIFFSYQIMRLLAHVHGRAYFLYRLVLLPGIVVHEMAHLIACWITHTPVQEVNFWTDSGGHVVHYKPRWPALIQPIISFAPFPAGIALLLLLSSFLTGHPWYIIVGALFLMLSIAATLAPSKADVIPSIEGILLLIVLAGGLIYWAPDLITRISPYLAQFQNKLVIVVLLTGGIWTSLLLLNQTVRQFRR